MSFAAAMFSTDGWRANQVHGEKCTATGTGIAVSLQFGSVPVQQPDPVFILWAEVMGFMLYCTVSKEVKP